MKKYTFSLPALFFLLGIWGCEKEYDNIVEDSTTGYIVQDSEIDYKLQDSSLALRLKFANDDGVTSVICKVTSGSGKEIPGSPVTLSDNGNAENDDLISDDNIYSGKIFLSSNYPSGRYSINFYITDQTQKSRIAASQSFDYDNGQPKIAPVISSFSGPDTVVVVNQDVRFVLTAAVSDPNGLSDIKRVFSVTIRPNGTSSGTQFEFNDTGVNGDVAAGDGVYSSGFTVTPDNVKGTYQFVLQAQDMANLLSEKFIHNLTIK